MTRPFMTHPELLESLCGRQYLVLRPVADVATFSDEEQSALRERLPAGLSWPDAGHVTLRGFCEPDRVALLCDALATWAENQSVARCGRSDQVDLPRYGGEISSLPKMSSTRRR